MKKGMQIVKRIANDCAEKLNIEIISVDFVIESGMKIIRIIARKDPTLTLDDSANLNQMIGDELDNIDFMEEQYYLEVSSEGIEKELKSDEDIRKAIGEYICIRVYKKINGQKEFYGDLLDYSENVITITHPNKKDGLKINKNDISKIRLAVRF